MFFWDLYINTFCELTVYKMRQKCIACNFFASNSKEKNAVFLILKLLADLTQYLSEWIHVLGIKRHHQQRKHQQKRKYIRKKYHLLDLFNNIRILIQNKTKAPNANKYDHASRRNNSRSIVIGDSGYKHSTAVANTKIQYTNAPRTTAAGAKGAHSILRQHKSTVHWGHLVRAVLAS